MTKVERNNGKFEKGHTKIGGRKLGSGGRTTKLVREALLIAAELEGSDGCGAGKLIGFMRRAARDELGAFLGMMGRLIPIEVSHVRDVKVEVTYRSVEEVRRELESRGIDIHRLLLPLPSTMIDIDAEDVEGVEDGPVSATQD